ncbi:MAG: ATP synthase F0 subunit C [Fimbriimonadales bacterium]|nr:ATP synthase F0 subunit C [Fimbriimonadales bacterium]
MGTAIYGIALGAGLAIGLAVLGAGLAQGIAANGAMNGMARQPELRGPIFTSMLIALAFMESLVLFTLFFVAMAMQGKIPNLSEAKPEQVTGYVQPVSPSMESPLLTQERVP